MILVRLFSIADLHILKMSGLPTQSIGESDGEAIRALCDYVEPRIVNRAFKTRLVPESAPVARVW